MMATKNKIKKMFRFMYIPSLKSEDWKDTFYTNRNPKRQVTC